MPKPRILLVKPGTAGTDLHEAHGDFERWFTDALGDAERFTVAPVHDGGKLPRLSGFDGVLVMGSPLSLTAPAAWMHEAGARLRDYAEAGGALLGVCFGHQLLAHAAGSEIVKNPRGRELGTVKVQLTAAGRRDPLFAGLGKTLEVQAIHEDAAASVPEGATLLASNEACAIQALSLGRRARTVQFHPEATAAIVRTAIRVDQEALEREGAEPALLAARVRDTLDGRRLLRNFEENLVGG